METLFDDVNTAGLTMDLNNFKSTINQSINRLRDLLRNINDYIIWEDRIKPIIISNVEHEINCYAVYKSMFDNGDSIVAKIDEYKRVAAEYKKLKSEMNSASIFERAGYIDALNSLITQMQNILNQIVLLLGKTFDLPIMVERLNDSYYKTLCHGDPSKIQRFYNTHSNDYSIYTSLCAKVSSSRWNTSGNTYVKSYGSKMVNYLNVLKRMYGELMDTWKTFTKRLQDFEYEKDEIGRRINTQFNENTINRVESNKWAPEEYTNMDGSTIIIDNSDVSKLTKSTGQKSTNLNYDMSNFNIEGDDIKAINQKKIILFFKEKDFNITDAQIAGILGNISVETNGRFDPGVVSAAGYHGIAQWGTSSESGNRWGDCVEFCEKAKLDSNSLEGQLEFMWHELTGDYSGALQELKNTGTVSDAAIAWGKYYEQCGVTQNGQYNPNVLQKQVERISKAEAFMK